ncbi:probable serine carboxypeptidase CPVL [Dermacentor silvarum]|uniref:probable serine carboxypeptidase CPVL n=1 Tax=Dermacentor silvarum TaxID=543639 RepID=UPI0021008FD5|nr:probable serine carboxypeptidase CPVL [Dermacentor silvarum]
MHHIEIDSHTDGHLADVGGPLFLTPLINAGLLDKARHLSRVGQLLSDAKATELFPSYAGFLTVNKELSSNIFFWFFPAKEKPDAAPVIMWLQGGPGGSSVFGLFLEHGPYRVVEGGSIRLRNTTWAQRYSMLYVDNPVGAGFSFTWSEHGYARDQRHVARDLHEALQQFFTLFPRFATNDFYVAGESYAGKYVTAVAHLLATTLYSRVHIKLRGIAVGNAWLDPETMLDYAQFLYHIGLVDRRQADHIQRGIERAIVLARHGRFVDAFNIMDHLLEGFEASTSYFKNVSGIVTPYNFLQVEERTRRDIELYRSFVATHEFRRAVHVGNVAFNSGREVASHLLADVMRSVKPSFVSLLERDYKVLVYSGQLDAVVPHSLAVNFLGNLQWSGTESFDAARRKVWRAPTLGSGVAGYVKRAGNLFQVMVRGAGHFVAYDQPEAALDMISRFINGSFL